MKKRVIAYSFKRGEVVHLDDFEAIYKQLGFDESHFKKVPDPNLSDWGNRKYETMSDYEKCTKGFKLTITIEEN